MNLPDFLTQDPDGYIHLTDHRIGLQDVVYFYNEGFSPAALCERFPSLTLPLIQKVLSFYVENRVEVDAYIAGCQAEIERQRVATPPAMTVAELRRRMAALGQGEKS